MNLDFSFLTAHIKKNGGTSETGGTTSNHAGLSCPTNEKIRWDKVGQTTIGNAVGQDVRPMQANLSHLSHFDNLQVGHGKASVSAAVPLVPPIPPKKQLNLLESKTPTALTRLIAKSPAANDPLLVGRYPHAQVKALARGLRILSVIYGWPEDDLRLLTDWFTREPQAAIEFIWDQAIKWEDMGQPFYNQ